MYIISQFSKITGLTVKALRYYDEAGILKPSFRKEENQYRYYNEDDLRRAQLVKFLRSLDFSIMELKEVMESVGSEEDLNFILEEKVKMIERNISKEKELIKKIRTGFPEFEAVHQDNEYKIDVVEAARLFVASIKFTGKYSDLDNYVPMLFKAVKNNRTGRHFNCYFDDACVKNAEIELCVPIEKEIHSTSVVCKHLPAIKALRTIHYGSYDTLYLAYKALYDYVNAHGYKILMPIRERYIKSPGMIFKGNPAN